jgi:hypothetical protein
MPKYKNYILYDIATGNILTMQNWPFDSVATGQATADIGAQEVDIRTKRYDAESGLIVDRSDKSTIENQRWINNIRGQRDARLAGSDWTQLPDVDLTEQQKQAWAQYRQQLRDIMDTVPSVIDENYQPTWPVPPSQ